MGQGTGVTSEPVFSTAYGTGRASISQHIHSSVTADSVGESPLESNKELRG